MNFIINLVYPLRKLCLRYISLRISIEYSLKTNDDLINGLNNLPTNIQEQIIEEMINLDLLNDTNLHFLLSPYLQHLDLKNCKDLTDRGLFKIACKHIFQTYFSSKINHTLKGLVNCWNV